MARSITLQPGESVTIHAAQVDAPPETGGGGGGSEIPETPTIPTSPPGMTLYPHSPQYGNTPNETGLIYVADLSFNGSRFATVGLPGQPGCYFKFICADFASIGWAGKVAQIQYSEYSAYGGQQYTREACFSKSIGAWGENQKLGSSSNYMVAFDRDYPNAIRMNSGDTWYMSVRNVKGDGTPSAGPEDDGDFQVNPGPPSVA